MRRPTADDAEAMNAAVEVSLDHLRPWMPWATDDATTLEGRRAYLEQVERGWEAGSDFAYLALDADGAVVGGFGLHRRIGPRAIELGYWIHVDHVGRGIATTVAEALTEAALALPDVDRVEIHCDEANVRSAAVPRRLGYRLERIDDDGITAPAEIGRSMIWIKDA